MFEVDRFQPFEQAVQLRDDGALEGDVSLLVEHESTEILVGYGLVVLQCGQQLGNPRGDFLIGKREQALLLTTDQIGQREIVFLVVVLGENNLIMRRLNGIAFYFSMAKVQSKRT